MIWTFKLNEPVPSLNGEQRVETVVLLLEELRKAPWQKGSETPHVENNVAIKKDDDWLDDSSDDEEVRKEGSSVSGFSFSTKRSKNPYPNFIIEERPEQNIHVHNTLLPMPGRAGARPLGKKTKNRTKRSLKDFVDHTGKNSLAYSVLG